METWQGEPAVRLIRARIAQEKVRYVGGLFFGLLAETALPSFKRFGLCDIAKTGSYVGARNRQQA